MRDAMNKRINQLVSLYQEHLGMYVTPINSDVTNFAFVKIDPKAWTRRFSFTISVAAGTYEVSAVEPAGMLPEEELAELQASLNSTQDFFGFLRSIRKAFKGHACKDFSEGFAEAQ